MATKTPAEKAIADVEKTIKDAEKAHEKYEAAQAKADEALEVAKRAEKELRWRANHPDLPDDFDLDEFRRSLEAPFDEDDEGVEPIVIKEVTEYPVIPDGENVPFDDDDLEDVSDVDLDELNEQGTADAPDDLEDEANAIGDAIESGEIDPGALEIDDDDPFADAA